MTPTERGFKTKTQRVVRSVYGGPLDKVTYLGSLAVIFYCLHKTLNRRDYADPHRNGIFHGGYDVAANYFAVAVLEMARLVNYTAPQQVINNNIPSKSVLWKNILYYSTNPFCLALGLWQHANKTSMSFGDNGQNAQSVIVWQILVPWSFHMLLTVLHFVHFGEVRDELIDKAAVKAEAGLADKCTEKTASVDQTPRFTTPRHSEPRNITTANTLVSNPVSSAQSLRKISGCMV